MYAYIKSKQDKPTPPAPTEADTVRVARERITAKVETAKRIYARHIGETLAKDVETFLAALDKAQGEVAHVDMVLARRDALEHLPNRIDKIMHTLATAKEADALRAKNAAQDEQIKRLERALDEAQLD